MNFSQEFRKAIRHGAPLERFSSLLRECSRYHHVLQKGEPDSPIHLAALNDRLDVIKLLVQHGFPIEPVEIHPKPQDPYPEFQDFQIDDGDRFTGDPLLTSAVQGKQDIFNFLAPLTSPAQRRNATLYLADGIKRRSVLGSEDEVAFQNLVNTRPSTDNSEDFGQWLDALAKSTVVELGPSDVRTALSSQFAESCQSLLEQGVDIDQIGDNGCTFLWTAAHNGYIEAVSVLIELGASVDIPNQKDGWTPLMIAVDSHIPWTFGTKVAWERVESRQVEIVDLLIRRGADLELEGNDGETALSLAGNYDPEGNYDQEVLNTAIDEMVSILNEAIR